MDSPNFLSLLRSFQIPNDGQTKDLLNVACAYTKRSHFNLAIRHLQPHRNQVAQYLYLQNLTLSPAGLTFLSGHNLIKQAEE